MTTFDIASLLFAVAVLSGSAYAAFSERTRHIPGVRQCGVVAGGFVGVGLLLQVQWFEPVRWLSLLLFALSPFGFLAVLRKNRSTHQKQHIDRDEGLRILVKNARELVFRLDRRGLLVNANPAFKDLTGFDVEKSDPLDLLKLVHPDDNEIIRSILHTLLRKRERAHGRLRIITPQREIRHVDAVVVALRTPEGRIDGFQGIARDVTAEHRALTRVQHLANVITDSTAPIILFDEDGRIQTWNKGAEKVIGLPAAHAISRSYVELFPDLPDLMLEVEANGGTYTIETEISVSEEEDVPVLLTCYRTGEGEGRRGYALILQDIRRQRMLEERLQQRERMEALGKLAGGIAHDFNNLLTIINGNAVMLNKRISHDDKLHRYVEGVLRAADRGSRLVQRLMAFGRKQAFTPSRLDPREVVEDLLDLLRNSGWQDIKFERKFDPELPVFFADPGRLQQVFLNLFVNARDAMPRGGAITVHVKKSKLFEDDLAPDATGGPGTYLTFSVQDEGVGMDRKTLQNLFEPFFTTKGQRGTGLGLATVHSIVQLHRGWIEVESVPGAGSTFHVYLPVRENLEEAVRFFGDRMEDGDAIPLTEDDAHSQGASLEAVVDHDKDEEAGGDRSLVDGLQGRETVLLVDDEDLLRDVYGSILETYGYRVLLAANAEEALRVFSSRHEQLDLAILDLAMPGMDGFELYQHIRKAEPGLPILFQSGLQPPLIKQALETGSAQGFLQKPFLPEALVTEVRRILDEVA
ncbi:PAS domain-containing protein [bacterium]|nr:PAS domain-containing protein [bacterium]